MTAYQELEQNMSEAMAELLGSGYVADYYRQAAGDFIGLAEWYADRERRNAGRAALDAVWVKIDRRRREDPTFTVLDCLCLIADDES